VWSAAADVWCNFHQGHRRDRYKAVNMAGAAVIVAITNALKGRDFPFVFGGDGASFAVAAADAGAARQALAETATWVNEDLDLELRIGLTPITAIRAPWPRRAGRTLCALSEHLDRDVFRRRDRWADAAMKRGEIAVAPAPPGAHPDLSGLSCRYEEIPSSRGTVLSLVAAPAQGASAYDFGPRSSTSPRSWSGHRTLRGRCRASTYGCAGRRRAPSSRRGHRGGPAKRCGCAASRCWPGRCSHSR
jgi:hypothetical protein